MTLKSIVLSFVLGVAGAGLVSGTDVGSHDIVRLWPDGLPNSNRHVTSEEDSVKWYAVDTPVLHIFPAGERVGKTVLLLPGGGYRHIGMEYEGYAFVDWYNRQGIDVAILQYRMPYGHPEVPLSDVHQSMRLLRSRFPGAKVGVHGFSAGGHLASMAATHHTDSVTRPDFQILFYPVIAVSGPSAHAGSSERLLGAHPPQPMVDLYNNHLQVNRSTPPAFIAHSADDSIVPVANSVDYFTALQSCGVPASLHIYPTGDHGWCYNLQFVYNPQWKSELEQWLSNL